MKEIGLDFIIDKLTNSIENAISGDSFATDISLLTTTDLKSIIKFTAEIKQIENNNNNNNNNNVFISNEKKK